jgi:hypothetical protein
MAGRRQAITPLLSASAFGAASCDVYHNQSSVSIDFVQRSARAHKTYRAIVDNIHKTYTIKHTKMTVIHGDVRTQPYIHTMIEIHV